MPMDEEKIIESKRVETPPPVKPKIKGGEPQPKRPDKFTGEMPDMAYISLAGYFSADLQTDKDQLKEIYNWASNESGSSDRAGVLLAIRGLEQKLGTPKDMSRINNLLNWIKLDRQSQLINKEKRVYER